MKTFDKDSFRNITLLYVEDDEMTLEEISFFLKKYVKKLIVAKNGEEGLENFLYLLRKLGLEDELRKAGVEDGDIIRIDDLEFEFID